VPRIETSSGCAGTVALLQSAGNPCPRTGAENVVATLAAMKTVGAIRMLISLSV
jgi:hypothetical protein